MKPTNDSYKKTMAKNGMEVVTPSTELQSQFKKIGEVLGSDWAKAAGTDGQKLIEAYRK